MGIHGGKFLGYSREKARLRTNPKYLLAAGLGRFFLTQIPQVSFLNVVHVLFPSCVHSSISYFPDFLHVFLHQLPTSLISLTPRLLNYLIVLLPPSLHSSISCLTYIHHPPFLFAIFPLCRLASCLLPPSSLLLKLATLCSLFSI